MMKVLAFVDLHSDLTAFKNLEQTAKKEKPDVVICAGDFTIFERFIEEIMYKISSLAPNVLFLHGNHETPEIVEKLCSRYKNTIFIHEKIIEINNILFLGYGGGGFDTFDKNFEKHSKTIENELIKKKIVLVTHAPTYGTNADLLGKKHCGNKSYAEFIKRHDNIILNICGHFHETAGKKDKLNNAIVINPGKRGFIIELK